MANQNRMLYSILRALLIENQFLLSLLLALRMRSCHKFITSFCFYSVLKFADKNRHTRCLKILLCFITNRISACLRNKRKHMDEDEMDRSSVFQSASPVTISSCCFSTDYSPLSCSLSSPLLLFLALFQTFLLLTCDQ